MSLTGRKLIAAVRAAANENPDFVYETTTDGCVYVNNGQASCIVGRGAWDLGLIDSTFENDSENAGGVVSLLDTLGLRLGTDEINWLATVQDAQDSHVPWGKAVEKADEEVGKL